VTFGTGAWSPPHITGLSLQEATGKKFSSYRSVARLALQSVLAAN